MNSANSQNIMRRVLASLLNSDIATRELREFALNVERNGFASDLKRLILNCLEGLENSHPSGRSIAAPSDEEALLEVIRRKRMSKIDVVNVMNRLFPGFRAEIDGVGHSARDIVQMFLASGSNRKEIFLNALSGGGPDDPYLKGILNRGK